MAVCSRYVRTLSRYVRTLSRYVRTLSPNVGRHLCSVAVTTAGMVVLALGAAGAHIAHEVTALFGMYELGCSF